MGVGEGAQRRRYLLCMRASANTDCGRGRRCISHSSCLFPSDASLPGWLGAHSQGFIPTRLEVHYGQVNTTLVRWSVVQGV